MQGQSYVLTKVQRDRSGCIAVHVYRPIDHTSFIFQQGEYVADVLLRPYLRLFRHIGMAGEWMIKVSTGMRMLNIDHKQYDLHDMDQVLQLYEDYPEEVSA